jgi:hypothetical protein
MFLRQTKMVKSSTIFRLYQGINEGIKDNENYNSGLIGESLIIATYKQASIANLEKFRFVINKIIREKKKQKRINDSIRNANIGTNGNLDIKK